MLSCHSGSSEGGEDTRRNYLGTRREGVRRHYHDYAQRMASCKRRPRLAIRASGRGIQLRAYQCPQVPGALRVLGGWPQDTGNRTVMVVCARLCQLTLVFIVW